MCSARFLSRQGYITCKKSSLRGNFRQGKMQMQEKGNRILKNITSFYLICVYVGLGAETMNNNDNALTLNIYPCDQANSLVMGDNFTFEHLTSEEEER